jgi:hypothetical protein
LEKKSVIEPPKNPKINMPMKQPLSSGLSAPHCVTPMPVMPAMKMAATMA